MCFGAQRSLLAGWAGFVLSFWVEDLSFLGATRPATFSHIGQTPHYCPTLSLPRTETTSDAGDRRTAEQLTLGASETLYPKP